MTHAGWRMRVSFRLVVLTYFYGSGVVEVGVCLLAVAACLLCRLSRSSVECAVSFLCRTDLLLFRVCGASYVKTRRTSCMVVLVCHQTSELVSRYARKS